MFGRAARLPWPGALQRLRSEPVASTPADRPRIWGATRAPSREHAFRPCGRTSGARQESVFRLAVEATRTHRPLSPSLARGADEEHEPRHGTVTNFAWKSGAAPALDRPCSGTRPFRTRDLKQPLHHARSLRSGADAHFRRAKPLRMCVGGHPAAEVRSPPRGRRSNPHPARRDETTVLFVAAPDTQTPRPRRARKFGLRRIFSDQSHDGGPKSA